MHRTSFSFSSLFEKTFFRASRIGIGIVGSSRLLVFRISMRDRFQFSIGVENKNG